MKVSLGGVSFQISRLIHWNKTMLFKQINNLITHKGFYHLCNMIYDRYWTIIIFVINVVIILIDSRDSGVLPVLLKDTQLKGFIYHICLWENLPIEICGADSLNQTRAISNISSVGLLGRDPKYVLISSLDIFVSHTPPPMPVVISFLKTLYPGIRISSFFMYNTTSFINFRIKTSGIQMTKFCFVIDMMRYIFWLHMI